MERIDSITVKKGKSGDGMLSGLLKRFKAVKHIEYIIAAVFIGIMLLILFSGNIFGASSEGGKVTLALSEYGGALEKKMEGILSKIEGAGSVSVMITFETGIETITAYTVNEDSNTVTNENSGGSGKTESQSKSSTPVIVNGKAVVLKEIEPVVKGVIVVSEGAGSVRVKIELVKAISTLLGVDADSIEIFQMSD